MKELGTFLLCIAASAVLVLGVNFACATHSKYTPANALTSPPITEGFYSSIEDQHEAGYSLIVFGLVFLSLSLMMWGELK
jgi:hypothetical protein